MPFAAIQSIVHSMLVRAPSILHCSKKAPTLDFSRSTRKRSASQRPRARPRSSRLSPPPPPLVDSAQGSNALGFFLARSTPRATRPREPPRMMRLPQSSAAGDHDRHGDTPPARPAPQAPPRRAALAGYLQKILTARVYDVAIEIALEPRRRSRRGSATTSSSSARTRSRCSASSCAAPTTRWRTCAPTRCARGVICASAGNHAQGVALAARTARLQGAHRDADDDAAAQGRRRARARRRGRAARRQLLRRLRPRAARSRPSAA